MQVVAREIDASPSQVVLNWLRQRGTIPIVGARKLSQVNDNLGCLTFKLGDDHVKRLNEVSAIDLGFPHDFLLTPTVRQVMFQGTDALIDNHRA